MTWIKEDKTNDISYSHNFVAPDGSADLNKEVLFPLAEVKEPAYAAAIAVEVKQMDTFVQPAELTGNATLNVTINEQVTAGAKLHLKLDADDTQRTVALGTGFDAAAADVVVPATKVVFLTFVFDGTAFVPVVDINYVGALIAATNAAVDAIDAAVGAIDTRVTAIENA